MRNLSDTSMKWIDGGVTAPFCFMAGGTHCGIKKEAYDIAIVFSERDAVAAGCFTKNKVKAAPAIVSIEHLKKEALTRAVVINSGCANTATGEEGLANAMEMARVTSEKLGIKTESTLVCSTGRIGVQLPMDKVKAGISRLAKEISITGGKDAAEAILTTDIVIKEAAIVGQFSESTVKIGAMAKGSGMIAPNMATMIAVLTTDAQIDRDFLQEALSEVVSKTFNRITVDGDTSTNDTVIIMANATSSNPLITKSSPDGDKFKKMLYEICLNLALQIVKDGEGATKLVKIEVRGAKNDEDAVLAAQTVADTLLFKVALNGFDPNWGRIMSGLGRSYVEMDQYKLDIYLNDLKIVANGLEVPKITDKKKKIWANSEFDIIIDLKIGEGIGEYYTCDISHKYIDINL